MCQKLLWQSNEADGDDVENDPTQGIELMLPEAEAWNAFGSVGSRRGMKRWRLRCARESLTNLIVASLSHTSLGYSLICPLVFVCVVFFLGLSLT